MIIYVGLSTLEYLKRGGRIKPTAAAVAGVLNISQ
ncbi:MAG: DegV family protein [Muricoprocola sp.]